MTRRLTVDGTPVSDADLERMHAEEELHAAWQRRTVRVVASAAADAADCRQLLDILGLGAAVITAARAECAADTPAPSAAAPSASARRAARTSRAAKGKAAAASAARAKAASGATRKAGTAA